MCSQLFSTFQLSPSIPQTLQCRSPSSLGPFMIMWSPPLPKSKSRIQLIVSKKVAPKLLATHSSLLFAVPAHRNITPPLLKKTTRHLSGARKFCLSRIHKMIHFSHYAGEFSRSSVVICPHMNYNSIWVSEVSVSITNRRWSTLIPGKHSNYIFGFSTLAFLTMESPSTKHFSPTCFTITVSQCPTFFHFPPAVTTPPAPCFSVLALQFEFQRLSDSVPKSRVSQIYICRSSIFHSPQIET